MRTLALAVFPTLLLGGAVHARQGVVVKGVALDPQTIAQLQRVYGAIAPGRNWYYPVSAL